MCSFAWWTRLYPTQDRANHSSILKASEMLHTCELLNESTVLSLAPTTGKSNTIPRPEKESLYTRLVLLWLRSERSISEFEPRGKDFAFPSSSGRLFGVDCGMFRSSIRHRFHRLPLHACSSLGCSLSLPCVLVRTSEYPRECREECPSITNRPCDSIIPNSIGSCPGLSMFQLTAWTPIVCSFYSECSNPCEPIRNIPTLHSALWTVNRYIPNIWRMDCIHIDWLYSHGLIDYYRVSIQKSIQSFRPCSFPTIRAFSWSCFFMEKRN